MRRALKIFQITISLLLLTFSFSGLQMSKVNAEANKAPLELTLFWGQGCPHCAKEKAFLETIQYEYRDKIIINYYEIYNNQSNSELFLAAVEKFNIDQPGVPLLIIDEDYIIGYGTDDTSGKEIVALINTHLNIPQITTVNDNEDVAGITDNSSDYVLNTQIFGNIDLKDLSLPVATILIALVDGFNPCAMWILIFLITMLINMKDRKKLYILGTVFIFTSGLIYLFFLAAWLNLFQLIGYVYWIKFIIGVIAIVSGIIHIKDAFSSKGGCKATDEKQRTSIMDRVKKTVSQKSFLLSILGIITLAISVNLIELVCSAGLPAIYTNLLSTVELTNYEYYAYLILYVLIFMLDDLLVFFIAIRTFEVTGIAKKYTKWSSLIGGILILIIGIILIVKPELLMFG